jgi:hypothetical protein
MDATLVSGTSGHKAALCLQFWVWFYCLVCLMYSRKRKSFNTLIIAAFVKYDNKRGADDNEVSWTGVPTPRAWRVG